MRLAGLTSGLLAALVVAASAQVPRGAMPFGVQPAFSVSGRVETPGAEKQLAMPGLTVTLHRVASDSSGALDSVRTDADGRYTLHYRHFGADDAIYFAAAVYRGIAYFSAPLKSVRATGEEGIITVFDTTTRAIDFHVQGHHVVVGAAHGDGLRDIVEVWELSNDTTLTVVGRDSISPVWTAPLPPGATGLAGGQGDVAPDAIVKRGNRVGLLAAFGPGVKQISYSYTLPASAFPLTLTTEHPTSVYEVLLEEPTARVTGTALRPQAAATTQGRTFQRFLGQDIPRGTSIAITAPKSTAAARQGVLIGLAVGIVLVMVAALARALMGRGEKVRARPAEPVHEPEAMLRAIAMLDARKERGDPTLADDQYHVERATLKAKLGAALVGTDRTT